jgi:signal transduction histidine kinase
MVPETLSQAHQLLKLRLRDGRRGVGSREQVLARPLGALRDRVAEHGGRLAVDSAPGAGTRVRACFPVDFPLEAG